MNTVGSARFNDEPGSGRPQGRPCETAMELSLTVDVPDRVRQIIEEQCCDLGYTVDLYNLERIRDRVHVRDPILMVDYGDNLVEVI